MSVKGILRGIETKCRKAIWSPTAWLRGQVRPRPTKSFGSTAYGAWSLVDGVMRPNGKALLCGAGEDVSFDLAVQKHFNCDVVIVDPTPRAVEHFEKILGAGRAGARVGINNSSSVFYELSGVDFSRVNFLPLAVWREKATKKFWRPYSEGHVSHSITNYQGAARGYIEVEADTLDHVIQKHGIAKEDVDLVKLDIEGAEYSVIDWMCEAEFLPRQLLIEFDEMNFPQAGTKRKIKAAVSRLQQCGYQLFYFDERSNCGFIRD
jgi:FkbM family methyltransferase